MEAEKRCRGRAVEPRARRGSVPFVALLLCLGLTGCKTTGVKESFMALDGSGDRRREHFFVDTEEIHCISKMASGVADITVSGALRAQRLWDPVSRKFRDHDVLISTEELAPGAGKDLLIDFKVEHPEDNWPYLPGNYTCELSINGELEVVLPFDIAFPDCPAAPLVAGGLCEGYVAPGAKCPSLIGRPCVCGDSGAWECQ